MAMYGPLGRPDPEHQRLLRVTAAGLEEEFDGVFGRETIERFVHETYGEIAAHHRDAGTWPLLTERFARQRLQALARVEGRADDGKPIVLFLCVHNTGRSQMAMGFFGQLAGSKAVAWSAGSDPGDEVNPAAAAAMEEHGIDITREYPKPWTDEIVRAADVVVTMGCGDTCPVLPGKRYVDWPLDDPAGQGVAEVRPIRDEIERRVRALLDDLDIR
ncbi:arsenate reductase ArsC [Streptomyces boninensis]|uniref:arsenate reductase ArsC n=1 Tax=Streptomyces boninensis TaxID=2039455 RepID=UPI003B227FD0